MVAQCCKASSYGCARSGSAISTTCTFNCYPFQRPINRIQLAIHPEKEASKRVAKKTGYTLEGLMRGCWFHQGRFQDLEIWSILRDELPAS